MLTFRKVTMAAATALVGGALLASANPAAAVEAHSGIQPGLHVMHGQRLGGPMAWHNGRARGYRYGGNYGYGGAYAGGYGDGWYGNNYDYPGWALPLAGVFGLAGTVGSIATGPAYINTPDNTSPCYFVRKPVRDEYGRVVSLRPGNSCEWGD
jgi:hypothetical protein